VAWLTAVAPPVACFLDLDQVGSGLPPPGCGAVDAYLLVASDHGAKVFAAMSIVPWLVGGMIGVVIVGREVEQRTAPLAWSLSPDRRRWLLPRAAVGGALVALLLLLPASLTTELVRLARPWRAPTESFDQFGLYGPLIVVRGLTGFAIGLLAGAALGRVLPALLTAGLACAAVWLLLSSLMPYGSPVDPVQSWGFHGVPLTAGQLQDVEARESLLLGTIGFTALALSLAIVDRRRPV
jgi:hypothetical protein